MSAVAISQINSKTCRFRQAADYSLFCILVFLIRKSLSPNVLAFYALGADVLL
jgi:hypothetical protein